jgi:hypothetical protein
MSALGAVIGGSQKQTLRGSARASSVAGSEDKGPEAVGARGRGLI